MDFSISIMIILIVALSAVLGATTVIALFHDQESDDLLLRNIDVIMTVTAIALLIAVCAFFKIFYGVN